MLLGVPVAFSFLLVNIVGVALFLGGEAGLSQLIRSIDTGLRTFTMLPVPLFILMGEVLFHSGLAVNIIDALDRVMGRLPGRLGLLAVVAGVLLSTLTGSSMGSAAILGSTLVPEMEKRGYKKPMSLGPVIGSGGLAMMIPPSAGLALFAVLAKVSMAKVLMAGIIPGILLAFFYSIYIVVRCWLQPSIAPPYEARRTKLSQKMISIVRYVLPCGLIVFLVTGVILLGIATPSEAAASGALGSLLLVACYGKLNGEVLKKSFFGTARIGVMILIIYSGSIAFSQILAVSGAIKGLVSIVISLNLAPLALVLAMQVATLVLGCFVGPTAIMMISLPIYMPLVNAAGLDPVWFSLLMILNIEMAGSTPPFGMLLFVIKGIAPADTTLGDVIKAGAPFLLCDVVVMALVIAFPILALWLPGMTG